jgi:short subunit fatty acids transporter
MNPSQFRIYIYLSFDATQLLEIKACHEKINSGINVQLQNLMQTFHSFFTLSHVCVTTDGVFGFQHSLMELSSS